jgi:Lhr-like helicase
MSLTATLIAFATGFAAKVRLPASDREKISEVERLRERIETLERELAVERSLKAHWREEASRLATQARERRQGDYAQAQMAQMAQAQMMNAVQPDWPLYQQQLGLNQQNLLGAQNAYWRDCTCIPDRASALNPRTTPGLDPGAIRW